MNKILKKSILSFCLMTAFASESSAMWFCVKGVYDAKQSICKKIDPEVIKKATQLAYDIGKKEKKYFIENGKIKIENIVKNSSIANTSCAIKNAWSSLYNTARKVCNSNASTNLATLQDELYETSQHGKIILNHALKNRLLANQNDLLELGTLTMKAASDAGKDALVENCNYVSDYVSEKRKNLSSHYNRIVSNIPYFSEVTEILAGKKLKDIEETANKKFEKLSEKIGEWKEKASKLNGIDHSEISKNALNKAINFFDRENIKRIELEKTFDVRETDLTKSMADWSFVEDKTEDNIPAA